MKLGPEHWIGLILFVAIAGVAGLHFWPDHFQTPSPTKGGESRIPPLILNSMPSEERSSLYASAKAEGAVTIYAANSADVAWIPRAFAARYPGIDVRYVADANTINQVLAEVTSGQKAVDLVWNSERLLLPLKEKELLESPDWVSLGVTPENVGAQGVMAITNSSTFAVAYRTDLVDRSHIPNSWQELTDSAYHGKMATNQQSFISMVAGLGAVQGELKWLTYAKKFCEETGTEWTSGDIEKLLSTGKTQYVVATSYYLAAKWKESSNSIDFVIPQPAVITNFGSVVMRDAPHPNAARLLASWLASSEGRISRERATSAVDLRASSQHPLALQLRASQILIYEDSDAAIDERNRLMPRTGLVVSLSKPSSATAIDESRRLGAPVREVRTEDPQGVTMEKLQIPGEQVQRVGAQSLQGLTVEDLQKRIEQMRESDRVER